VVPVQEIKSKQSWMAITKHEKQASPPSMSKCNKRHSDLQSVHTISWPLSDFGKTFLWKMTMTDEFTNDVFWFRRIKKELVQPINYSSFDFVHAIQHLIPVSKHCSKWHSARISCAECVMWLWMPYFMTYHILRTHQSYYYLSPALMLSFHTSFDNTIKS
jgi:hypothetical protein